MATLEKEKGAEEQPTKQALLSPFEQYVEGTRYPVVKAPFIEDLFPVELGDNGYDEISGAVVELAGAQGLSSVFVWDLPVGLSMGPSRHLFEEWITILTGTGEVEFEASGGAGISAGQKRVFPLQKWSVFVVPPNLRYGIRNTGSETMRIVSVNTAPLYMDLLGSSDAVFEANITFPKREREIFTSPLAGRVISRVVGEGGLGSYSQFEGAVLQDAATIDLPEASSMRGEGFGYIGLDLAGGENVFGAHVMETGEEHLTEAHYHMGGAVLMCAGGEGYSLTWDRGAGKRPYEEGNADQVIKAPYKPSGIVSVGIGWYHMHLNTGRGRGVRQIAFRYGGSKTPARFLTAQSEHGVLKDRVLVPDLDPQIHAEFQDALARRP